MARQAGPDELLPIGEFSRRSSLSIHQLRHYHEVGLLEPRVVDSESGYRYYSPFQVQTAELIAILRSLDLPLAEIRQLLENPRPANVSSVLDRHRRRLEARFAEASSRLEVLARLLKEGQLTMQLEIPRQVAQVRVDGVRVHVPSGQHAVVLVEEAGEKHLPIWIGMAEATAIATRLEGVAPDRPMTHDLLTSCLTTAAISVRRMIIWRPDDRPTLYLAAIDLQRESKSELLDARPSDAINLALRTGAPIFVATKTLATGVSPATAAAPVPEHRIPVRVISEEGTELGTMEAVEEPQPGFRLNAEFEVSEVRPQEEGGYKATARPLPQSGPRFLYRPPAPRPIEG